MGRTTWFSREAMRGWFPAELEVAIVSCLAKEPDQRPANARALAAKLRAIAIPDEHAWMAAKSRAWWDNYQPAHVAPTLATSEQQVIMPGNSEQRPLAATSEDAIGPTIAPGR